MPFSATVDKHVPKFLPRWKQIQGRVAVVHKFGVISSSFKNQRLVVHGPIQDVRVDGMIFQNGNNTCCPPVKIDMVIQATGYEINCLIVYEDRVNGLFLIGLKNGKLLPLKSIGDDAEVIARRFQASLLRPTILG
jgi:hypothetical protein